MPNELLTRKEVAQMLSVDPLTVRDWERSGKLTAVFHLNGKPRYSLESIEKLVEARSNVKK